MCGLVVLVGVASKDMVKLLKESEAKRKIESEYSIPTVAIQQESSLQAGKEGQIVGKVKIVQSQIFCLYLAYGFLSKVIPKK